MGDVNNSGCICCDQPALQKTCFRLLASAALVIGIIQTGIGIAVFLGVRCHDPPNIYNYTGTGYAGFMSGIAALLFLLPNNR
jgi:hypothetical protein